jgi:hypothetical protein
MAKSSKIYLCCVCFLIALVLIISLRPKKEGFGTPQPKGMYDYLAPMKEDLEWSDSMLTKFVDKYNETKDLSPQVDKATIKKHWKRVVTEAEVVYYIDNGQWPMNQYISNFLFPESGIINYGVSVGQPQKVLGVTLTPETLPMLFSARAIYQSYIRPLEMVIAPMSYQIFMGTKDPPSGTGQTGLKTKKDSTDETKNNNEEDSKRKKSEDKEKSKLPF